jgi:excisionase family DNA binding protein
MAVQPNGSRAPNSVSNVSRAKAPRRRPNGHNVKKHRSYTVAEAAQLLKVHKVTVRNWIKSGGLPALVDQRPILILGRDLKLFFAERRTGSNRTCRLDECYCLKCRAPQRPAFAEMELVPLTPTKGNLLALCEVCASTMRKHISLARLPELRSLVFVKIRQASPSITNNDEFCLNTYFSGGRKHGES